MTPRHIIPAAIALSLLLCAGAIAQDARQLEQVVRRATQDRLLVNAELSLAERSEFDVGGTFAFYALHLNDADDNSRRLLQPEVSLYARGVVDGAHRFFGRVRGQYQDFSTGDSFDEDGDGWTEPFLERYWYEFDLASAVAASEGRLIDGNVSFRIGRQFVDWNAGLAFSDVLLAVRPRLEFGPIEIDAIAGVTPGDEEIVDFDASREGFDSDTERGFFGATLTARTPQDQTFYTYILRMEDFNSSDRPRFDVGGPVDFTYEATYLGVGSAGPITSKLRYLGEFVWQRGRSQSDPLRGPQTTEDIDAFAGRLLVTYLPGDDAFTRFEFEGLLASGDDDRLVTTDTVGGNLSGTDDNAFNSLGFVNTGLAFAPALSNLATFRAGVSTFPLGTRAGLERFQVGLDVLVHNKFDSDAPIAEPSTDNAFLGVETDVSINYRVTSDLAVSARYGVFLPGDGVVASHTRHFVFFGFTLAF